MSLETSLSVTPVMGDFHVEFWRHSPPGKCGRQSLLWEQHVGYIELARWVQALKDALAAAEPDDVAALRMAYELRQSSHLSAMLRGWFEEHELAGNLREKYAHDLARDILEYQKGAKS